MQRAVAAVHSLLKPLAMRWALPALGTRGSELSPRRCRQRRAAALLHCIEWAARRTMPPPHGPDRSPLPAAAAASPSLTLVRLPSPTLQAHLHRTASCSPVSTQSSCSRAPAAQTARMVRRRMQQPGGRHPMVKMWYQLAGPPPSLCSLVFQSHDWLHPNHPIPRRLPDCVRGQGYSRADAQLPHQLVGLLDRAQRRRLQRAECPH